jgi:hypothetical protein
MSSVPYQHYGNKKKEDITIAFWYKMKRKEKATKENCLENRLPLA